jgi:Retinal pigment epithelial membrane protein
LIKQIDQTSTSQFIPSSSNDTNISDPVQRSAAIKKRRTEQDVNNLLIQFCWYLSSEEAAQVPSFIQEKYGYKRKNISGIILCFDADQIKNNWSDLSATLPDFLKDKISAHFEFPKDLCGYAFYVAPVPPQLDNNPIQFQLSNYMSLNGDGMIYRLGFSNGKVSLKSRLMKTPCYYADIATQILPKFDRVGFRFLDGGMVRHSVSLGTRNQANTALLATRDRLIVTFDGGRPHVIDPDTLEILEPVGQASDWISLAPSWIPHRFKQIFQPYSNPAHPQCEHCLNEEHSDFNEVDGLFSVNYSQGLSLLRSIDLFRQWLRQTLGIKGKVLRWSWGAFTDLIRYRFEKNQDKSWQKIRLFLPNGEPVVIEQSVHQMALTEDYILIGDIAFEIEVSQIFGPYFWGYIFFYLRNFSRRYLKFSRKLGYWISLRFLALVPPFPFAHLYLISRSELDKALINNEERVTAKKVCLPREVSHFVVDYQNPNDIITLHSAHSVGWDVTEWIDEYDQSVGDHSTGADKKELRVDALKGTLPGPVDLNLIARYEIDGQTGTVLKIEYVSDPGENKTGRNTWSLSVNTHRNLERDQQTERAKSIKNIYWMSWGFSWEMIPDRIYLAYKDRDVRTLPIEALPPSEDKPMSLLRFDTEVVEIVDSFEFPIGCFARSPQFIPSSQPCPIGQDESVHGYISCAVMADDEIGNANDEFWVFHADDFINKPFYRLRDPSVVLGLTIHSTWLSVEQFNKTYSTYPPEKRSDLRKQYLDRDYSDLIQKRPVAKDMFDQVIYPHFIRQTSAKDFENFLMSLKNNGE